MALKAKGLSGTKDALDCKFQAAPGTAKDVSKILYKTLEGDQEVWEREQFKFTIDTRQTDTATQTSDTTFSIPTSGAFPYHWLIDWGDGNKETVSGTGVLASEGIPHTYTTPKAYQITITPAGSQNAWFRAFGFSNTNAVASGANTTANRNKMVGPDSSLSVQMFANAGATYVSDFVGRYTFCICRGYGFRLGADFRFRQEWNNVLTVGHYFGNNMFGSCATLKSLPANFNLPKNLTTVGWYFGSDMFYNCPALISLPDDFNIPQGITSVGQMFCNTMFLSCTTLPKLPDNFNLPQGITTVDNYFCSNMFSNCHALVVNSKFRLPKLSQAELDKSNVFSSMFSSNTTAAVQNVPASTIINGNLTPTASKRTFSSTNTNRWSDYNSLPANWKQ